MQNLETLKNLFQDKEWFYDVGQDAFNRPVVYVHLMNLELFSFIRTSCSNPDLLIHYASYAKCDKANYVSSIDLDDSLDLEYLESEVRYLQSISKRDLLQNIFYEIHDGVDAVTNLSTSFPEVRKTLEDLYETYGYDLLYEKLEN
jgi:hypothetical protein